jgi:hypothetical protein
LLVRIAESSGVRRFVPDPGGVVVFVFVGSRGIVVWTIRVIGIVGIVGVLRLACGVGIVRLRRLQRRRRKLR